MVQPVPAIVTHEVELQRENWSVNHSTFKQFFLHCSLLQLVSILCCKYQAKFASCAAQTHPALDGSGPRLQAGRRCCRRAPRALRSPHSPVPCWPPAIAAAGPPTQQLPGQGQTRCRLGLWVSCSRTQAPSRGLVGGPLGAMAGLVAAPHRPAPAGSWRQTSGLHTNMPEEAGTHPGAADQLLS